MTSDTYKDEGPPEDWFYRISGTGNAPWEIGRPQPVIIKLVEQGVFQGEVLDIGCGIGDNAIYIATHANDVHITGFDLIPKAVEVAREKAEKNKANIQFEVLNILDDLSKTNILKQHSYDTVLDVSVFHIFSDEDRQHYMKNLEYLIKPGGLYIQIVLSEKENFEIRPRRVKESDLTQLFSSENGWTIESIQDNHIEIKLDSGLEQSISVYLSLIKRNNNS